MTHAIHSKGSHHTWDPTGGSHMHGDSTVCSEWVQVLPHQPGVLDHHKRKMTYLCQHVLCRLERSIELFQTVPNLPLGRFYFI